MTTTGRLTRREKQLVELLADGKPVPQIADALGIARRAAAGSYTVAESMLGVSGEAALVDEAYRAKEVSRPEPGPSDSIMVVLPDEQRRVLTLVAKGLTAPQMAEVLGWTVALVRRCARDLLVTLGATNGPNMIKRAWQLGLLTAEESQAKAS
ncbi:LuxR C-terminal-related transcriptional regulator [Streptomyces sp. NPDC015350]|uniref:LuxR C-terminal-related transcriptional regulator n=1 Tax=Streptomyces sp. NPDC015350 TaxID=3364955 RepID=UPI0036F54131